MPIDRWMVKEVLVHIYNGILLSHKKERNWVICWDVDRSRDCHTDICSNMGRPVDYHMKWGKSDREKQMSYDITYVECKNMIQNKLFTKQKQTHILKKYMYYIRIIYIIYTLYM